METVGIALEIVTLLAVVAIGYLLKDFFPSYTTEKGKNVATKEDIEAITEKIESVKVEYAKSLEAVKARIQIESALKTAYQQKCLEAITAINDLLVEITLYCWREIAERSPNEHYVWSNVDDRPESRHFHYYRVAIDKATLIHGMYLTQGAQHALDKLSNQIGLLSSMELALTMHDPEPRIVESAESGYSTALASVEHCRRALIAELGLSANGAN